MHKMKKEIWLLLMAFTLTIAMLIPMSSMNARAATSRLTANSTTNGSYTVVADGKTYTISSTSQNIAIPAGTTVSITVKPDTGYEVDEVGAQYCVYGSSDVNNISVTSTGNNTYTFTLPNNYYIAGVGVSFKAMYCGDCGEYVTALTHTTHTSCTKVDYTKMDEIYHYYTCKALKDAGHGKSCYQVKEIHTFNANGKCELCGYEPPITEISKLRSNPVEIKFGSTYGYSNTTKTICYYSFTLTKPAKVALSLTSTDTTEELGYEIGTNGGYENVQVYTKERNNPHTYTLGTGTYIIEVCDYTGNFNLKLSKEDFNWGTISYKWNGYSFTATYHPAGNLDKGTVLTEWYTDADNETGSFTFSPQAATSSGKIDIDPYTSPGSKTLYVTVYNKDFNLQKTFTTSFTKKPSKLSMGLVNITAYKKKIKFSGSASGYGLGSSANGDKIAVQIYQKGKWVTKKTFESGTTGTLSGLKANTTYKLRLCGMVSASGSKAAVYGTPSATYTIKTGTNKPAVKSVKISKAKYKYIKKVWHSGYWSSTGHYYKGYYSGGYYVTNYTVTVKLKKALKSGQKLIINNEVCKGKGKKFTLKTWTTGKMIGKKLSLNIMSIQNSTYKGYSDTLKKKAVIHK